MNESWLRRFQWYRRKVGGYWTHSYALGWRTLPNWSADMDLEFSQSRPDMYRNGLDIEDYRVSAEAKP